MRELENILERALTLCEGNLITAADLQLPDASEQATPVAPLPLPVPAQSGEFVLDDYLGDLERVMILKALEQTRYNKTAAAKLLGISFRALRYKLKKLEIE